MPLAKKYFNDQCVCILYVFLYTRDCREIEVIETAPNQ